MNRIFGLGMALCLSLVFPTIVQADITRGCSVVIFASNSNFTPTHRTLAEIKTQGACNSRAKANTCRSRAYGAAKSCTSDLWAARWNHTLPSSCNNLGSGRTGAKLIWNGIISQLSNGQNSLKDRIEFESCCRSDWLRSKDTVHVRWLATGDKGCGPHKTGQKSFYGGGDFARQYGINCAALRTAGICGKPTRTNK